MATAVSRADWGDSWSNRSAESLDRVCIIGIAFGLALWVLFGYGLKWAGEHFTRPPLTAIGGLAQFLGIILLALLVLRWVAYMVCTRMAMLLDREVGACLLLLIAYLVVIGLLVVSTIIF